MDLIRLSLGVLSDKGGSHVSQLLNGRVSKAHGLVNFREALERAGLLPPRSDPASFEAVFARTSTSSRTTERCDWREEASKAAAFEKARSKAVDALRELASAMESPTESPFFFSLLQNFYLAKADETRRLQGSHTSEAPLPTAAEQVRELAEWIQEMGFTAASGWHYSSRRDSGANLVQSASEIDPDEGE